MKSSKIIQEKKDRNIDRDLVEKLIKEREKARKNRNWKKADSIRNKLKKMEVELRDNVQGTEWRVRK